MVIDADIVQRGLGRIRERLFQNQPETVSAVSDLIDLLDRATCEHQWVSRTRGAPSIYANAIVIVCEKCGLEK